MTINEVLEATSPCPAGTVCAFCEEPAAMFWPVTYRREWKPYCKEHLQTAQLKLAVACGIASIP